MQISLFASFKEYGYIYTFKQSKFCICVKPEWKCLDLFSFVPHMLLLFLCETSVSLGHGGFILCTCILNLCV